MTSGAAPGSEGLRHFGPRTGDPFRLSGKWSPSRSANKKTALQRGF